MNAPIKAGQAAIKIRVNHILVALVAAGIAGFAAGCASVKSNGAAKEVDVTLAGASTPARATIEKETAGGHVDKITREVERGKTVYDVEATSAAGTSSI